MRTFFFTISLAATLTAAAAAQTAKPAPAKTVAADTARVGTYDIEIALPDGTMTGELTITRDGATLGATISAGPNRPAVKSFVREGNEYVLTAGHGDFNFVYRFTFAKDSVKGAFKGSAGLDGFVIGALRR